MSEPIILYAVNPKARDKMMLVYGKTVADGLVLSGAWSYEQPESKPEATEAAGPTEPGKPAPKGKGKG
jgi:hypothetical protein